MTKINRFFNKYFHLIIAGCFLVLFIFLILQSSYCRNMKNIKTNQLQSLQAITGGVMKDQIEGSNDLDNQNVGTLGKNVFNFGMDQVMNIANEKVLETQKEVSHYSTSYIVYAVITAISLMGCLAFVFLFFKKAKV